MGTAINLPVPDRVKLSFVIGNSGHQRVKLLASNCYKLCCVLFVYYAKHSSVSATVLQKRWNKICM